MIVTRIEMKPIIILILLILFLLDNGLSQVDSVNITFNINTPQLSDSSTIFITGNHPLLGNWQPDKTPLKKTDQYGLWYVSLNLPVELNLKYKFTQGSWDTEALEEDGQIPPDDYLILKIDTTIIKTISLWKNLDNYNTKTLITGTANFHQDFKDDILRNRDIVVSVVKPFIDKTYKTLSDRENTSVGGSSLGGLISFMLLWEHHDIFSKAACLSPVFKNDSLKIDYVQTITTSNEIKRPIQIYIDNGTTGAMKSFNRVLIG
jgi:hypothetical protein